MPRYSSIAVIYNPSSTGDSQRIAEGFVERLRQLGVPEPIELIATDHQGHAEDIAYELATSSQRPLVVSSSGDGGYHEVVNGLMRAADEGYQAVASLLPAGNANDHHRNLTTGELAQLVACGREQSIDLLRLEAPGWSRYAHSYIGLGITPAVGQELNKVRLNIWHEVRATWRALANLKPVRLDIGGVVERYDSVVCSNVASMAKVLTLAADASARDGKFEVTLLPHRSPLELMQAMLLAAATGSAKPKSHERFDFRLLNNADVQLDGEIHHLAAGDDVSVAIAPLALRCLV